MERIAVFEKVSFEQFRKDWKKFSETAGEEEVRAIYDAISLPKRATAGSAGYDFCVPCALSVPVGQKKLTPPGIRAKIDSGYVLILCPRSSLGFKYRFQLDNTAGIIDSDYYHADNEGHIMCKMINDSREGKTVEIKAGDGMVQGLFLPFGITEDDHVSTERTGGFGSTDKQQ